MPQLIQTDYADKENSIRAFNQVDQFQDIENPWDKDDLYTKDFRSDKS